ncbi:hypothetical protein Hamer_G008801 [Homarus americanus]|uniref:Uncharacterized protein n=1 Tax=Homarus americanus TaxID=6706 RepID=A0A8J5JLG0_HOMAM|nr:hypothetical protein Hamer_G008801 [Homarus americanus]
MIAIAFIAAAVFIAATARKTFRYTRRKRETTSVISDNNLEEHTCCLKYDPNNLALTRFIVMTKLTELVTEEVGIYWQNNGCRERERMWRDSGCGKTEGVARQRVWRDSGCAAGELTGTLVTLFHYRDLPRSRRTGLTRVAEDERIVADIRDHPFTNAVTTTERLHLEVSAWTAIFVSLPCLMKVLKKLSDAAKLVRRESETVSTDLQFRDTRMLSTPQVSPMFQLLALARRTRVRPRVAWLFIMPVALSFAILNLIISLTTTMLIPSLGLLTATTPDAALRQRRHL